MHQALMAILVPIIFGLVSFFAPDPSATAKPSTMPDMPQWLLSLMMVGNDGIIAIPTVFLVSDQCSSYSSPMTSPADATGRPGSSLRPLWPLDFSRAGTHQSRAGRSGPHPFERAHHPPHSSLPHGHDDHGALLRGG